MNKTMKQILSVISCFILCVCLFNTGLAEKKERELQCWVLCQPDSYVNVREFAKKGNNEISIMECGDAAYTNGQTKRGFLYLCEVNNELGYGWIHKGYIVYSKPIIKTFETNIYSTGRVACLHSISGTRKCWIKPGDVVTVYAISDEWSVTNKGFIKTKYLGVNYDLLSDNMERTESYTESADLYWEDNEG